MTIPSVSHCEPFPSRVNIELTNYCNQRCTLCPRQAFTRPLGFMDPVLYERVVRECAPHRTKLWLHFLGEPLLHRDLVRMIRFAKDAGVAEVGLSTNAATLRAEIADQLIGADLDRLECSVDADNQAEYLAMRGRDHFTRVIRNVRDFLLRKRALGRERPLTSVQFMRTAAVEASLPQLVAAWRPFLGPRDFVMTIVPASFAGAIELQPPAAAARPPCRWLFSSLMVLQDGTVTMCGADWDAQAALGNLHRERLVDIWNGAELQRRRRAHLDGRFADAPICGGCEDWRLADGHGYVNAVAELERRGALPDHGAAARC